MQPIESCNEAYLVVVNKDLVLKLEGTAPDLAPDTRYLRFCLVDARAVDCPLAGAT